MNRLTVKAHAIVLLLLIICAGRRSHESNVPANGNSAATVTPVTTVSPAPMMASPVATTVKAKVDICNLLTSDDLKTVQGYAHKEAQRSDRQDGDFIVAQCYFALPTSVNSVVLNVTTAREGSGARSPRDFWEDTFRKAGEDKNKSAKERSQKESAKDRRESENEEESAPPERVRGLGEEAFWIANRIGGVLYVLKNDVFFRISVGGADDARVKLNKSKMLAQKVLQKL